MGLLRKVLGKETTPTTEPEVEEGSAGLEDTLESAGVDTTGSDAASGNGHGSEDADDPAWMVEARELGERGQDSLDQGDAGEAVLHLLESLKIYEAHEDEENALAVSQSLGAALYDLGRQNEAVSVWEEIISRGCVERPVYERLIDHYEELDRGDDVARVRLLLDSLG